MEWSILEMLNARGFKPLIIVFSTPDHLLIGITEALGSKESHYIS